MANQIGGKAVVAAMNTTVAEQVAHLKQQGCNPTLAILRVGDRPDAVSYQAGATKRNEQLGITVNSVVLPQNATQDAVLQVVDELNRNPSVHGVLMLRPFPSHMDDRAVREALAPEKDVDGITNASLYGVFTGVQTGFPPCTAEGCLHIFDHYQIPLLGRRAVVVGASLVIGRPVAMMLLMRGATVTICHIDTVDLPAECRRGEVLVVAAGKRGLIGADCLSPGQVILDVGVNVGEDGKLYGDVDFAAADKVVQAISPVPGGVGAVTTSVLASHVVQAAQRALCHKNG